MLQQHRNDGGSVVRRHGLVGNGYGQRGAQRGLTCPLRVMKGLLGQHAGLVVFCGCLLNCC